MRREKSRKRMEKAGEIKKKERRKEADSNGREKMFCLWRVWAYGL